MFKIDNYEIGFCQKYDAFSGYFFYDVETLKRRDEKAKHLFLCSEEPVYRPSCTSNCCSLDGRILKEYSGIVWRFRKCAG